MINTKEDEHIVTQKELIQLVSEHLVQTHFEEIKLFLENHRTSKYIDVSVVNNQLHFGRYGEDKISYYHVSNPKAKSVNKEIALQFINKYLTIMSFYDFFKFIISVTEITDNSHLMMVAMNYYLFNYLSDESDNDKRNEIYYSREFVCKYRTVQVKVITANIDLIYNFLTKHPNKLDLLLSPLAEQEDTYMVPISTHHEILPEMQLIIWRLMELVTTTKSFTSDISIKNLLFLLQHRSFISDKAFMSRLRLPIHYLSDFLKYVSTDSYNYLAPHIHFVINSKCDVLWLLSVLESPETNLADIKSLLKLGMTIDGCDKFTNYIDTWLKLIKPANNDEGVRSVTNMVMSIFYPF